MRLSRAVLLLAFAPLLPAPFGHDAGRRLEAQETVEEQANPGEAGLEEPVRGETTAKPEGGVKIMPEYPEETPGLVFVEGESAVSTNFANEPTLNFGCSGSRTLQLSRTTGLHGGRPFFAEYVFYVPEEGTYEFWYGGTPPGPREDIYPSFASPFSYTLDGNQPVQVYREEMTVVEGYAPGYYWCVVDEIRLQPGSHKIRFEISEQRRYDARYYFYLDALFFFQSGTDLDSLGELPDRFPKSPDERGIDNPFRSIATYENFIRENPDNVAAYIELSLVYSLIGDYVNAVKYLRRASLIEPDNTEIQLLTAKNRIWRGDVAEGLAAYRKLLENDPERLEVWREAAKVAAWVGKYDESLAFYRDGLEVYEENLDLLVNRGITHLWRAEEAAAAEMFTAAEEKAEQAVADLADLGGIYEVNGYPDYAVETYRRGIEVFPRYLELYLKLADVYAETGRQDQAEEVYTQIEETFVPSPRLTAYLDISTEKQGMRDALIAEYERRLQENPDDPAFRELLVQTYFWNGLREKAIGEYYNMLVNLAYRNLLELDTGTEELNRIIDELHVLKYFFESVPDSLSVYGRDLETALTDMRDAEKNLAKYLSDVEKAREKGEEPPEPEEGDTRSAVTTASAALADAAEVVAGFFSIIEDAEAILADSLQIVREMSDEDTERKTAFHTMTDPLGWSWDRPRMMNELGRAAANDNILATHVIGKLQLIDESPIQAGALLSSLEEQAEPSGRSDYVRSLLHSGNLDAWTVEYALSEETVTAYAPFTDAVVALYVDLYDDPGYSGTVVDSSTESAESLVNRFRDMKRNAARRQEEAESGLRKVYGLLEQRLERSMFQFEEDTKLIRYQLGDYFLTDEWIDEAGEQFKLVLKVDPWHVSALYKLGTVQQLAGRWYRAMKTYEQVYAMDPRYENTAANHNLLARTHADDLSASAATYVDTGRVSYTGSATFDTLFNSVFSLGVRYDIRALRIYTPPPGEYASSHMVHEIGASLPIDIYPLHLKITPYAALEMAHEVYGNEASEGSGGVIAVEPTLDGETMVEFLGAIVPSPKFSGEVVFSPSTVALTATYAYGRKPDTYVPGRAAVMAHSAALNAFVSFDFLKVPLIGGSYLRSYGKLEFLDDDNMIGTVVQDLYANFHVADTPWTNVAAVGSFSFEHSKTIGISDYYAPDGVISIKGGVAGSTWIGFKSGGALGISLNYMVGGYLEQVTEETSVNKLLMDGSGRVELSKGGSSYYLAIQGTGTFPDFPDADFWSLNLTLGMTAKLPDLLSE